MGKSRYLTLIIFMLSILIIVGCSSNSSNENSGTSESSAESGENQEIFELSINNFYGANDPWVYGVYEPWKEFVEEKTDGRIIVNITHGSTLGRADSALKDVQGGLYDLAYIAPSLHSDTELYPLTIGALPFAFPNAEVGTRIMEKFADKYGEFNDYVHLGMITSDPYMLWTNEPVEGIQDVKNKKIRITGKNDAILFEGWGATPVSVPIADVYEAIQKTTIDGVLFSPIGGMGSKFNEVAPNLLELPFNVQPLSFGLNQNFYDQLPEDLQQLMDEELSVKLVELFVETYTNEVEKSISEFSKSTKAKVG